LSFLVLLPLSFLFRILHEKPAFSSEESTIDISLPQFLLHTYTHSQNTYRTVPDPRALKILGEFSPLVEIGAGNG
jgi:hypothetical protein